jgi:putative glycosyltransferase (TIGR04372 family)
MKFAPSFFEQVKATLIHISKGGKPVLIKKLKIAPYRLFLVFLDIITLPISIPLILLIRLIKPIYHIHLGYFYGGRIGHFVYDTVLIKLEIEKKQKGLYLFYFLPNISNKQWAKMVRRELNIYFWVRFLVFANSVVPGGEDHAVVPGVNQHNASRDTNGMIYNSNLTFQFTDFETIKVKNWLKERGWKEGEKIICVLVRDNAYLPGNNWSYHDFRNSNVNNFIPAMEFLANKGYWVIRMGKVMKEPLNSLNNRIIDYSFDNYMNDLFDVWLFANCDLCITTSSGPDAISCVYRRPLLHINSLPLTHIESYANVVHAPKKLFWKKSGKLLTFKEYCDNDFSYSERYEYFGINIVELSSDEIINIVKEKIEMIEGGYKESEEDKLIQKKFWEEGLKIKKFANLNGFIHPEAKISNSFVKQFPDWFE